MKAHLSRRYHFSASHRLHTESYDAARNAAVFGKCNNPHGHGHNYTVQVTLSGQIDPATGMVCSLTELDAFAQTNLLERFDHTNLNTLECFREVVPTTENLVLEIRKRLEKALAGKFVLHVRVEETSNNFFEYWEEGSQLRSGWLKSG